MTDLQYPIAVHKVSEEDGGGYLACAVDLKGCIGDGATPEEAIADLKDAIIEWIDEARRLERQVPEPGQAFAQANKERLKIHKERQEMSEVIRKQDELLDLHAATFDRLRGEIAHLREFLREQIAELADKAEQNEGEAVWGCGADLAVIIAKKDRHHKNDVQH
jgi:antitoxin HicB